MGRRTKSDWVGRRRESGLGRDEEWGLGRDEREPGGEAERKMVTELEKHGREVVTGLGQGDVRVMAGWVTEGRVERVRARYKQGEGGWRQVGKSVGQEGEGGWRWHGERATEGE